MPANSDDMDDLLRRAMKTLDDEVPSGYFEALPNRTLARLEDDESMQTTGTSTSANQSSATGVPPTEQRDRNEDSGLHDIRSLASSTKMRLSQRMKTTAPPFDEDILASSSAGWKAVALPEPAKMVSLPELAELPSMADVKAAAQAHANAEKQSKRTSAKKIASAAVAVESTPVAMTSTATAAPVATSVEAPAATPMIGARLAQQTAPKSRTGLYAVVGLGLAAAAGAAFFVLTKKDAAAPQQVAAVQPEEAAPAPAPTAVTTTPTVEPIEPPPAAEPPPPAEPAPETVAAAAPAADEVDERKASAPAKAEKKRAKETAKVETPTKSGKDASVAVETKKPAGGAGGGEDGEPSFDQLLKEAGVQDNKPAKPKLEKKALTGADIKAGMGGVAGKAQACFSGTEGTAQVKLTVTPDGKVEKVKVTGAFAGTPVASCVEAAVKSATFPPWDGGPQSFGYSYLLAE